MSQPSAHFRWMTLILACLTGSLLAQAQSSPTSSGSAVPAMVKFGGTVSGAPSRLAGLTFALYKDQQGGAPLWLETQSVPVDATGHYTVQLGATLPDGLPKELFVSGEARWLGVQREGQAEQPRVLLLSVPYALKAADAETLGGLPLSAFVLATPSNATPAAASAGSATSSASAPPPNAAVTGLGTLNFVPLWDSTSDIVNSAISQTGTGTTAKIGINTTAPTVTLDVKGAGTIRGALTMATTGTATATTGKNSQPLNLSGSAFNSGTSAAVNQTFRLQTEPAGNNSASPSGKLNLLYYSGSNAAAETGLSIASNGRITFADGQTFPGAGTITSVTAGPGLTGGGTGGDITVALTGSCGLGQFLQWNSVTWICTNVITNVAAGTDLTGSVTNGIATLNLDTTTIPQLNAANVFIGSQTVNGNLSATGTVTGSSFQIGSNLFAYGSYANSNAFLGFGGSALNTGTQNTAVGAAALFANTSGAQNTAVGSLALSVNTTGGSNAALGTGALNVNTTGSNNTASGTAALQANTTGSYNTAHGLDALMSNTTGSYNSALGFLAGPDSTHPNLTNSTAIGAEATVTASNSMVLGSISGVNGAGSSTNIGIGTTAPAFSLDVHGTGNFTGPVTFASSQTFPNTISGVAAGTGLTGGGTAGNVTLNLDTTKIPQLLAANSFVGNQAVTGNLTLTGKLTTLTGSINAANGIFLANSGIGVYGQTIDASSVGVEGLNNASTGGVGVFGVSNAATGTSFGVWGKTNGTSSNSIGVEADAANVNAVGLVATNLPGAYAAKFFGEVGVTGDLAATGNITGVNVTGNNVTGAVLNATTAFDVGGTPFAFGSFSQLSAFLGFSGGIANSAQRDTANGVLALAVDTGGLNTASGTLALRNNTTGTSNTATGEEALVNNTIGAFNMADGFNAMLGNTSGINNTAGGSKALLRNSTGGSNTAFGFAALFYNVTGTGNTAIGNLAGPDLPHADLTNSTAIGANATVTSSNALVLGSINGVNNATASTNVGIGTTAPLFPLHVERNDNSGAGVQVVAENPSTSGASFAVFNATSDTGVTAEMVGDGLGNGPLGKPSGYFGTYTNQPIGFITGNIARMTINTTGQVGVGTLSPTRIFSVGQGLGHMIADGYDTYSSRRWKTNIQTLPNALAKVEQLRGVSYDLKGSGKHEIGVIAEEVGQVVPEVVSFEANGKDAQGVDYSRLCAVLIEAVKEQQRQIADQQRQIRTQQRQIARLNSKVGVLETGLLRKTGSMRKKLQPAPKPTAAFSTARAN